MTIVGSYKEAEIRYDTSLDRNELSDVTAQRIVERGKATL